MSANAGAPARLQSILAQHRASVIRSHYRLPTLQPILRGHKITPKMCAKYACCPVSGPAGFRSSCCWSMRMARLRN